MTCSIRTFEKFHFTQNHVARIAQDHTSKCGRLAQIFVQVVLESVQGLRVVFQSVADLMVKIFFRSSKLVFFNIIFLPFVLVSRLFNSSMSFVAFGS